MELLNRRRELGLPSHIIPIEYLEKNENSGKVYFNLNYAPKDFDNDLYAGLMLLGYGDGGYNTLIGTDNNDANSATYRVIQAITNANGYVYVYWGSTNDRKTATTISINVKYDVTILRDGNFSFNNINGVAPINFPRNTENIFYIFNGNVYGRIYYCKLIKADDVIFDLIPVRIENKGYLYDKITNKLFKSTGDGKFTLGPDIN